jgi:hypothetical protein
MLFEKQGADWPDRPAAAKEAEPQQAETIELRGTVVKKDLEGGLLVIESDDGKTYEPLDLPEAFQKDGMKVRATVRVRNDVGSIHMVGDIIEILEITAQ